MEVDALNKTIDGLDDKLKRTKDKHKAQFKEQKEKLESKDNDLLQLRATNLNLQGEIGKL